MTRGVVLGGVALGVMASLALTGCNRTGEAPEATEAAATEDGAASTEDGASAPGAAAQGEVAETPAADSKIEPGAAGAAAPAPAASNRPGEAEFERLISGYLDTYAADAAGGWPRARGVNDVVVAINAGQEYRWPVTLQRGQTYAFVGACDNECNDVDIVVEDASGREVASDVLTDDYPVVQYEPTASGRYTARIVLVTCTIEPCYVGGRLLQQ